MQGFSLRQRIHRRLVCGACVFHMAATVATNLPANTAFGGELRAPFAAYLDRAGLWQNWVMFHTIPYFRAIRPRLVASASDGSTREFGPMLPGLAPYRHTTRIVSLFLRYTWPPDDIAPHVHAYLRRACDEVARATGSRPASITLRLDSLRLQPLAHVRAHHELAKLGSDLSTIREHCP
jgi:hypothetical protein